MHPNCPKASNPYHECGDYCMYRNGEVNALGVKKESGLYFFFYVQLYSASHQFDQNNFDRT